jgi:hypothetical protein
MRASRVPGVQPAGRPPARLRRPAQEFAFEAPQSIINLVGQLLGQGQQREVLAVAARAFLDGKGYSGDAPFEVRILSVQIASPAPIPPTPPASPPAESNGQG